MSRNDSASGQNRAVCGPKHVPAKAPGAPGLAHQGLVSAYFLRGHPGTSKCLVVGTGMQGKPLSTCSPLGEGPASRQLTEGHELDTEEEALDTEPVILDSIPALPLVAASL